MSRYFQHKLPGKLIIYLNKHISEHQVTKFLSEVLVNLLGKYCYLLLCLKHHKHIIVVSLRECIIQSMYVH